MLCKGRDLWEIPVYDLCRSVDYELGKTGKLKIRERKISVMPIEVSIDYILA